MTPLRSRNVSVELAILGELPAVVESEDEQSVVVSLVVRPPRGLDRAVERGPVCVECVSARGIQRVTGTAVWRPSAPDQLRITREDDAVIQRRGTVRVGAVLPASITDSRTAKRVNTTTFNVSATGLLFRDPLALPVGSQVRVVLSLEDGGAIAAAGRVVREAGQDAKGVHVDEIAREDQDRLMRFITERQRAELRIARDG
jgi:hypothetical protein